MVIYKSLVLPEIQSFSGNNDIFGTIIYGLKLISDAGYDGAELSYDLTNLKDSEISDLKTYIDNLNSDGKTFDLSLHLPKTFSYTDDKGVLHRASFNLCGYFNENWADASNDFLTRFICVSETLGEKYLNLHIEGLYDEYLGQGYNANDCEAILSDLYWNQIDGCVGVVMNSNLKVISDTSKDTNLILSIENHELPYHMSSPSLLKILNDYPSVNFLFDVGHPLKQLSKLEKRNDWGISQLSNPNIRNACIAEFDGQSYDDCIFDGGINLLGHFMNGKSPFAAHLHQIDATGADHLPLTNPDGIIDLETVTKRLSLTGTEFFVIESFEKNNSENEYIQRIKDEFDLIEKYIK